MKLHTLFFIPFLLLNHTPASLSAMELHRAVQALSLMSLGYAAYADATQPDLQLRKQFRAGGASALITAGAMRAIELSAPEVGSAVKILTAVAVAAGFNLLVGVSKHIAELDTQKRVEAYCKGLLCGFFIVLPFCSDL